MFVTVEEYQEVVEAGKRAQSALVFAVIALGEIRNTTGSIAVAKDISDKALVQMEAIMASRTDVLA